MIAIQTTSTPLDTIREQVRHLQRGAVTGQTIRDFAEITYHAPTWGFTTWLGVPALKHPCDLFSLHDLIIGFRPSLIIETGTAYGGSALFMAHVCDLIGHGAIVSIDLEPAPKLPQHQRISYLTGRSSVDPEVVALVTDRARRGAGPVLVILDSDHHEPHVLAELEAYAPLVTAGSFLVVEDTNVNGHPVLPEFGPGPAEAVDRFLLEHPGQFERDVLPERYLVTMHPGGWLRRVA